MNQKERKAGLINNDDDSKKLCFKEIFEGLVKKHLEK